MYRTSPRDSTSKKPTRLDCSSQRDPLEVLGDRSAQTKKGKTGQWEKMRGGVEEGSRRREKRGVEGERKGGKRELTLLNFPSNIPSLYSETILSSRSDVEIPGVLRVGRNLPAKRKKRESET